MKSGSIRNNADSAESTTTAWPVRGTVNHRSRPQKANRVVRFMERTRRSAARCGRGRATTKDDTSNTYTSFSAGRNKQGKKQRKEKNRKRESRVIKTREVQKRPGQILPRSARIAPPQPPASPERVRSPQLTPRARDGRFYDPN